MSDTKARVEAVFPPDNDNKVFGAALAIVMDSKRAPYINVDGRSIGESGYYFSGGMGIEDLPEDCNVINWRVNENRDLSGRNLRLPAWLIELAQFDDHAEWSDDELHTLGSMICVLNADVAEGFNPQDLLDVPDGGDQNG